MEKIFSDDTDFDMYMMGYAAAGDPDNVVAGMFDGTWKSEPVQQREAAQLWKDGRGTSNMEERAEIYKELQKQVYEDRSIYPLAFPNYVFAVRSYAKRVPIPSGQLRSSRISANFPSKSSRRRRKMDMMTMVQRLTAVYGISGREAAVAEEIRRMAESYADEILDGPPGNLICRKKGEGPKVMFAAHLDSIGLIVTHIESKAFSGSPKFGGVRPEKILHSLVRFENGTIGTIASSGTYLGKLSIEDLYVDSARRAGKRLRKRCLWEMLPFIWGSRYRQAPHCFLPIWMTVWGA